jgi:hypothetical protein
MHQKTMIEIKIEYLPEESDGSLCEGCEQVIKGTMYVMTLMEDTPIAKYCVLCKLKLEDSP